MDDGRRHFYHVGSYDKKRRRSAHSLYCLSLMLLLVNKVPSSHTALHLAPPLPATFLLFLLQHRLMPTALPDICVRSFTDGKSLLKCHFFLWLSVSVRVARTSRIFIFEEIDCKELVYVAIGAGWTGTNSQSRLAS